MNRFFTRTRSLRHGWAALLLAGGLATPAAAQTAYGLLTSTAGTYQVVTFQVTAPGTFTAAAAIQGLGNGLALVGMDSRPATGEVYALGYNYRTGQAQLYTLVPATGALTAVGSSLQLALGTNTGRIGFDFDPVYDVLRVTAENRNNYRLNPVTGELRSTDTALTYETGDINASQRPTVGAIAFSGSYRGSNLTSLYAIDNSLGSLATTFIPALGALRTVGALGVAVDGINQTTDLDIYYDSNTGRDTGYLSLYSFSSSTFLITSRLYTVDLTSGNATPVGQLGTASSAGITNITLALPMLPPITGQLAYGLTDSKLVVFDTALPGSIRRSVGISGVLGGQTLLGLDVRPATNTLYALGYRPNVSGSTPNAQLYTLDPLSGEVTPVGSAIRLELGTGGPIGFDFSPADFIRVVSTTRTNYRLNVSTGALIDRSTVFYTSTTGVAPVAAIGAVAHSNSYQGATRSTLYGYDLNRNVLATIAVSLPPVDGQLTVVGTAGITTNATAPSVDLDIYSTSAGVNTAYLAANTSAIQPTLLYTVNLSTGATTLVGRIGDGSLLVRNIAIASGTGMVTANTPATSKVELAVYPNPVGSSTTVAFSLTRAARVELLVTDALGRTIDVVDAGALPAGSQAIRWNRHAQPAGQYFLRLRIDGQTTSTRQLLLTQQP